MELSPLWDAFLVDGNPAARDALLGEHLGLVHHVARKMSRTLSVEADLDELISSGSMGLINALESFDPSRGLAFSTFAAPRIRGAILDDLRRQDHVPRSVRRKNRDIGAARESLTRTLGRAPEDREVAEELNVDLSTLWRWQSDTEGALHISLDTTTQADADGPGQTMLDLLAGESEVEIEDRVNLEQEVDVLRDAMLNLKEQERMVVSLYKYYEELKLHEIATILGLTESRVSQIRAKALSKLRGEMAPLREREAA